MVVSETRFISVVAEQISNDANGATYRCTVNRKNGSYFGIALESGCVAIKKASSYINYWSWPTSWPSSWGVPDWRYTSGQYYNGPAGNLKCVRANSWTWTEYVSIPRNNRRCPETTISVGAQAFGISGDFNIRPVSLTLKSKEISYPSISSLSATEDSPQQSGKRYIRISGTFSNPDSFYIAKLFDSSDKQLSSSTGTSISATVEITKDMYETTKRFILRIIGKDSNKYAEKEVTISISPSGVGLYGKLNSNIIDIDQSVFKNVNFKQAQEVWIKINGEIKKTTK